MGDVQSDLDKDDLTEGFVETIEEEQPGSFDTDKEEDYSYDPDQQDVTDILTLCIEPRYISEITRILRKGDYENHARNVKWNELAWITALNEVSSIISFLVEEERIESKKVDFDGELQYVGSRKKKLTDNLDKDYVTNEYEDEAQLWNQYKLVQYFPTEEFNKDRASEGIVDELDKEKDNDEPEIIDMAQKEQIIKILSEKGNQVSKDAEEIMQDVMMRQFRYYKKKGDSDYNSDGLDFWVEDQNNRDYGLAIEVSTRYVNPIDKSYIDFKKEEAFDPEGEDYEFGLDLVILAPKFTESMKQNYEKEYERHTTPEGGNTMVHLHEVPYGDVTLYDIFDEKKFDHKESKGNPIIIPDNERVRKRLKRRYADTSDESIDEVSDYPIVEPTDGEKYKLLREYLSDVRRDYRLVTESRYRNDLREAIEPLLGNFLSPYRIEQFLIDMYWDKGLKQESKSEVSIGDLVDAEGDTIGRWMGDQKWDIITRGSGKKEEYGGVSRDIVKMWADMYMGRGPFKKLSKEADGKKGFSIYRIEASYNRHPLWNEEDWEEWAELSKGERKKRAREQYSYTKDISYTIMSNAQNRLTPSYGFIRDRLEEWFSEKDHEGSIRVPEEAPRGKYYAFPDKTTLNYMINRDQDTIIEVETDVGDNE